MTSATTRLPFEDRLTTDGRLEHVVLALVLLVYSGIALLFAVFPPSTTSARRAAVGLAIVLVALAVLTITTVPRHRDAWWDVCLALAGGLSALLPLETATAMGQMVCGLALIMLGVVASLFRRGRVLVAHLVWMLTCYGVALAVNPLVGSPLYWLSVAAVACSTAFIVGLLSDRLRAQAIRDPLTGLLNRHGLEEQASLVASLAARSGQPVSVALIDLDGFKDFNDRHGHVAGDDHLSALASSWSSCLREEDLIGRFGGDEFVLVLPGSTPEQARVLVSRLRTENDGAWSVGVAPWEPEDEFRDVIDLADEHMYADKRSRQG